MGNPSSTAYNFEFFLDHEFCISKSEGFRTQQTIMKLYVTIQLTPMQHDTVYNTTLWHVTIQHQFSSVYWVQCIDIFAATCPWFVASTGIPANSHSKLALEYSYLERYIKVGKLQPICLLPEPAFLQTVTPWRGEHVAFQDTLLYTREAGNIGSSEPLRTI